MKRLLIFCALWGAGALAAHSQTITVMAEQLAELKILEHTTSSGYQIMGNGVQQIGQITNEEYELHQTYYRSLQDYSTIKTKTYGKDPFSAELALRISRSRPIHRRSAGRAGAGQGKA